MTIKNQSKTQLNLSHPLLLAQPISLIFLIPG